MHIYFVTQLVPLNFICYVLTPLVACCLWLSFHLPCQQNMCNSLFDILSIITLSPQLLGSLESAMFLFFLHVGSFILLHSTLFSDFSMYTSSSSLSSSISVLSTAPFAQVRIHISL